jgi:dTDP-4-amino-4,6-dideoxygalactose transaminase
MFYLICRNFEERNKLIEHLRTSGILAVFHYQSLHKSDFYRSKYDGNDLNQAGNYTDCLLRLPLFYELTHDDIELVIRYKKIL